MTTSLSSETSLLIFLIAIFTLATFDIGFAQKAGQTTTTNQDVTLYVTVNTENRDFVTGLNAGNFKVYDEKKLNTITDFRQEDEPASVGILVDTSKSMTQTGFDKTAYQLAQTGLARFIELSNPANEYFLTVFGEKQELLLDFSQDNKSVLQAIEKISAIKTSGRSLVHDAVITALEKLSKSKYTKRVLIVVSDGMDNTSVQKPKIIKETLRKSNVIFYSIGIYRGAEQPQDFVLSKVFFGDFAQISGGDFFYTNWVHENINERELRAILAMIANEIRGQYTIKFQPESNKSDKKDEWREIKVKVELPSEVRKVGKVYVRTREGYYLTSN
ncbi:MAG: VWA domain-containing protein [Acidobacteriota bacterium]|nr:VWA domain-containing protein [Acidobacteriota bacterium]